MATSTSIFSQLGGRSFFVRINRKDRAGRRELGGPVKLALDSQSSERRKTTRLPRIRYIFKHYPFKLSLISIRLKTRVGAKKPNMEMLLSLTFLSLICLADATGDITHSRFDDSHVITTECCNFAITNRPSLNRKLWKTVTVNKNDVVIMTPSCQILRRNMLTISTNEKDILATARAEVERVNTAMNSSDFVRSKVSSSRFSPNGGEVSPIKTRNLNVVSYHSDNLSILMFDEDNFSLSKTNMPNNLARIFVNKDVVTYTYQDGKIEMKPQACLNHYEKLALEEYKVAVLRADRKQRETMEKLQKESQSRMEEAQNQMQDMHNYMQDMQLTMQQQMTRDMGFMSIAGGLVNESDDPVPQEYRDLSDQNAPIYFDRLETSTSRPARPTARSTPSTSSGYNRSPPPYPFAASSRKPIAMPTSRPYSSLYATNSPRPTMSPRPSSNPYVSNNPYVSSNQKVSTTTTPTRP